MYIVLCIVALSNNSIDKDFIYVYPPVYSTMRLLNITEKNVTGNATQFSCLI